MSTAIKKFGHYVIHGVATKDDGGLMFLVTHDEHEHVAFAFDNVKAVDLDGHATLEYDVQFSVMNGFSIENFDEKFYTTLAEDFLQKFTQEAMLEE